MSQDADLVAAIEDRLFTVVDGLPDEQHRRMENQHYDPIADEAWLRVTHKFGIEGVTTLPASGGRLVKTGFTQVDLFMPLGEGREQLDSLMDAVRDAFPARLPISVNGLKCEVQYSRRWGGQRDGAWFWDHVDIVWVFRAV